MRDAKSQLIDVAERLFAERGIGGVSLREVGVAAGQRNNSAAQYHFGSKAGLVNAIFETRMRPIDELRQSMLDEAEAAGAGGDLRALGEALVYPLTAALGQQGEPSWYARFLAQVLFHPEFRLIAPERRMVTVGLDRLVGLLRRALRHLPDIIASQRIELAATVIVHALADRERMQDAGRDARWTSSTVLAAHLVDVVVAMFEAPVSATTKRQLRAVAASA